MQESKYSSGTRDTNAWHSYKNIILAMQESVDRSLLALEKQDDNDFVDLEDCFDEFNLCA